MIVKKTNFAGVIMILIPAIFMQKKWELFHSLPSDAKKVALAISMLAICWGIDDIFSNNATAILDKPLKLLMIWPCMIYLYENPPRKNWLWLGAATGAILTAIMGVIHVFVFHYERAGGTYIHPIEFGDTSAILTVFSICAAFQFSKKKSRGFMFFSLIGSIAGTIASLLSGTRGAWLACAITLFIIAFVFSHRIEFLKERKKIIPVFFLLLLIATNVINIPIINSRINTARHEIDSYTHNNNSNTSVGARIEMWKFSWLLFKERPLTGWGQSGYDEERLIQISEKKISDSIEQYNHPHNDYLNGLSKEGIIGLISILICHISFFLYFFRRIHSYSSPDDIAVACAGLSLPLLFACFGLTDTHITSNRTIVMYFYLGIFLMSMLPKKEFLEEKIPNARPSHQ